jgi:hypothetical protein
LSRIIDRGRSLTEKPEIIATYDPTEIRNELLLLERRRYITSRAINMITVAALLVCLCDCRPFSGGHGAHSFALAHRYVVFLATLGPRGRARLFPTRSAFGVEYSADKNKSMIPMWHILVLKTGFHLTKVKKDKSPLD